MFYLSWRICLRLSGEYDLAIKTLHKAERHLYGQEIFLRNCLYLRAILYGMSRENCENKMNGKTQRFCVRRDIKNFLKRHTPSKTKRRHARKLLICSYLPLWVLRQASREVYTY